jgi:hypothetical protein
MASLIGGLSEEIDRSDSILSQARRSGMEVSEAILRQTEAREQLVKARVAVHAFRVDAVGEPVKEGLAIARETHAAGRSALEELDRRRTGLVFSLVAIGLTILGLWLWIRAFERKNHSLAPPGSGSGAGEGLGG